MGINIAGAFSCTPNMAQYDGADWNLQVNRMNGITLDQAYQYAYSNDSVTFFFRINDGCRMVLPVHGTFNSGDTVFFSGNPWLGSATNLANTYIKNSGSINCVIEQGNYFTSFIAKAIVPQTPPPQGILFLWPGLQPGNPSNNAADAIGNGVLQPVLTYEATMNSCAPNPTGVNCSGHWWISGQYVNTMPTPTTPPQFKGCNGGDRLLLNPGDNIQISMEYYPATQTWIQTIIAPDQSQVSYSIALTIDNAVQNQAWLLMLNEPYGGAAIQSAISLFDITITTQTQSTTLFNYLNSQPQVTGVSQSDRVITVNRAVFHSPCGK